MYLLNIHLTVNNPADVATVRELMTQCCRMSRAEPGCLRFDVYHSQTEPTRLLLVEHWQSKADWEAHRTRQAVTEIYLPKVLPLVDRQPHVVELIE